MQTENLFTSYNLTEQEVTDGTILTSLQSKVIQNRVAGLAQEKILTTFDPAHPESFIQAEAYMRGQLDILIYLLDESKAAQTANLNLNIGDN